MEPSATTDGVRKVPGEQRHCAIHDGTGIHVCLGSSQILRGNGWVLGVQGSTEDIQSASVTLLYYRAWAIDGITEREKGNEQMLKYHPNQPHNYQYYVDNF